MANVSDASGTIVIRANKKSDINFIIEKIFFETEKWYYNTVLDVRKDSNNQPMTVIKTAADDDDEESEYRYFCIENFYGNGRWNYISNIENLLSGVKEDNILTEEDIARLESIDFEINFNFVDMEEGFEVLYAADISLIHKAGQKLEDVKPTENSITNYDYTKENLINVCGYDPNDMD